jgi:hypothetical protein
MEVFIMVTSILIALITLLLGVLVGKVTNSTKIDKIYEKLIRVEERLSIVETLKVNQEEIFNRLRDVERDIGIIKNKLKIK